MAPYEEGESLPCFEDLGRSEVDVGVDSLDGSPYQAGFEFCDRPAKRIADQHWNFLGKSACHAGRWTEDKACTAERAALMPSAEPSCHASLTAYVAARYLYCDPPGTVGVPAEAAEVAGWLMV